jgi:hypothetical protein
VQGCGLAARGLERSGRRGATGGRPAKTYSSSSIKYSRGTVADIVHPPQCGWASRQARATHPSPGERARAHTRRARLRHRTRALTGTRGHGRQRRERGRAWACACQQQHRTAASGQFPPRTVRAAGNGQAAGRASVPGRQQHQRRRARAAWQARQRAATRGESAARKWEWCARREKSDARGEKCTRARDNAYSATRRAHTRPHSRQ